MKPSSLTAQQVPQQTRMHALPHAVRKLQERVENRLLTNYKTAFEYLTRTLSVRRFDLKMEEKLYLTKQDGYT
jgi:hypothetical protein